MKAYALRRRRGSGEPSPGTSRPSPGRGPLPTKSTSSVAFDAVIHNAGIGYRAPWRMEAEPGVPSIFAVNVLAAYILAALIDRPGRLVYVSSGMHHGVRPRMDDLLWAKRAWSGFSAYAESKLCDVLLAFAVARRWKDVRSNALEPGWVPTKMGGPSAPDDLHQGCITQAWLATSRRRAGAIERRVFLSSTAACAGLRAMSTSRRSCSQSAAASPVFL